MPRTQHAMAALLAAAVVAGGAAPAAEPPGIDWRRSVVVATGNAFRGPWRMNESVFDFVDDPTVALLPGGDAAVAWVDHTRKDVVFQRFAPGGTARLAEPVNVSASPGIFSWLPRLAVAPGDADTIYALWQEIVFSGGSHGGEIFFARSTDGGRSFGAPVNLSRTEAGAGKGRLTEGLWHNGSLDLAVAPDGTIHAAWTEYEGPLRVARSTDGGKRFGKPRRVAGGPGRPPARGPSLAAGPDGVVHLAWTVGGDPGADIRHARSRDGGRTFGPPRRIAPAPGHADAPKLALGADGTLHLAYAYSPEGPLRRYDVLYTRWAPGPGRFAEPRPVSQPLPQGFAGAGFPYLALAGPGRVCVGFELFLGDGRQRPFALGIAVSGDGGDTFGAPALVPGTRDLAAGFNGSQQGLLMRKLDAGPDGALAIVNSKFREDEASRIRLLRARLAGSGDAAPASGE